MVLGKYGFLYLMIAVVGVGIFGLTYLEAFPGVVSQIGAIHNLAILFGISVIFYCIRIKQSFGKIISEAFVYVIFSIALLTAVHVFHLSLAFKILEVTPVQRAAIEHFLFYVALISLVYGFRSMLKGIQK